MFSALNGILARFSGNQISYSNISLSVPAGMNFFSHPDFTVGTGIPCHASFAQKSHRFSRRYCGSRTIPPVGTCTLPRRLNSFYSYYYSALLIKMQPLLLIFNIIFVLKSISPTALSTNMLIFLLSY